MNRNPHSFAHLGRLDRDERDASRVLFVRARCEVSVETRWGESVVVVGSAAQLGGWRPECGARMATDEQSYPVWRCEPLLLSEGPEVEFKFVVLSAEGEARWEPLLQNRRLALDAGDAINIQFTSGTTGVPKAVALSSRNIVNNGANVAACQRLRAGSAQVGRVPHVSLAPTSSPAVAASTAHAPPVATSQRMRPRKNGLSVPNVLLPPTCRMMALGSHAMRAENQMELVNLPTAMANPIGCRGHRC